jgi:hypothetical protein
MHDIHELYAKAVRPSVVQPDTAIQAFPKVWDGYPINSTWRTEGVHSIKDVQAVFQHVSERPQNESTFRAVDPQWTNSVFHTIGLREVLIVELEKVCHVGEDHPKQVTDNLLPAVGTVLGLLKRDQFAVRPFVDEILYATRQSRTAGEQLKYLQTEQAALRPGDRQFNIEGVKNMWRRNASRIVVRNTDVAPHCEALPHHPSTELPQYTQVFAAPATQKQRIKRGRME